ncbi:GAF domain-containing protein [Cryobacterium sp. TMS1-13-1]|uniref:helix-turn-helix domain-containing protein n=1 Tax=Cryobacterium sp. TMS1-13-1 TaxID=1259220 RepID=UPI00106A56D4|nr:GAF domain-containing protein [Cryobacterium sp. TMS1-13-1]TFD20164.1 GAF domain-containing protein [Cryobacterium sp. TMS1-13-1]
MEDNESLHEEDLGRLSDQRLSVPSDAVAPRQVSSTGTGHLLALLDRGISATALESHLAASLHDGAINELTAGAVRRLNSQLQEAHRREQLLRVLYNTATDLTGIRDVEAILKAIVRRTRSLIGSDVAYLSLNDYVSGKSFVRVTDGATTTLFRNIRMPLGGGVLGAVATGESPAQTADYLTDDSISHFLDSDTAVAAEGVRAIMGVPLRVEGKVIGALLVADRQPHNFSSDDVSLMESIGTHAAVALENARHFSEMAEALAQRDSAQQENIAHVRGLEEIAALNRSLTETLVAAESMPRLVDLLAESLGSEVFVVDPLGEPLSASQSRQDFGFPTALRAAEQSAATAIPVPFTIDGAQYLVMSAIAGDQHLASLVVAGEFGATQLAMLERGALVLSVSMLFRRTLVDAELRLQLELIDDLLSPRAEETAALTRRAGRFGLSDTTPLMVRVISVADNDRQKSLALLRRAAEDTPGIIALHEGHLCVVEPVGRWASKQTANEASGDDGRSIVTILKRQLITATVGSSGPVTGFGRLAAAHSEAHAVLRALHALARVGEAADRAVLGTAGMLLGGTENTFAEQLMHAQLGPLFDYDSRHGTELTLTAWTFLENESAIGTAANELHVHANTLRQRLDRIDTLLDPDWRRGSRSLDVRVALRLWRLKTMGAIQTTS